jgi:hypothetical protein
MMQFRDPLGLDLGEAMAQEVGKEVVVAEPLPLAVKGHDKQVGLLQLFEDLLAAARRVAHLDSLQRRVTERPTEAIEDRGVEQKSLDRFGLLADHLVGQIVDHLPVVPGKGPDKGRAVRLALQRKGCHLQPGDPALGPGLQDGYLFLGELNASGLAVKGDHVLV